jgi:hypothetical protein
VACLLRVYDHHHIHPKVLLPNMVMRRFKAGSVFGSIFKAVSVFWNRFKAGSVLPEGSVQGARFGSGSKAGGGGGSLPAA